MVREFTAEDVQKVLAAQDLVANSPAELHEITYRLNALLEGLRGLDRLGLDVFEPWPTLLGIVEDDV